jgi:hypothetical protein
MLIMLSIFDMLYGVVFGAVVGELGSLQTQLQDHSVGLGVAGFFSSLTGGLVSFGDTNVDQLIKGMVGDLPDMQILEGMAIGRLGASAVGMLLGIGLALRLRHIAWAVMVFTSLNIAFGVIMLLETRVVYRIIEADPIQGDAILILSIDVLLHILWPLALGICMIRGRGSGDLKHW